MKCYYCGENEAELRFFVNYMGNAGEVQLCGRCAEKLRAYTTALFQQMASNGAASLLPWMGEPGQSEQVRKLGEDPFPLDAGEDIRRRRHLSQLRAALHKAVEQEQYEAAAGLRDKIDQFERGVCIHDT